MVPDTYFTISEELRLLGLSVILGAVMGTVFDILRAARYLLPSGTILTALGDILFFAAYTTAFGAFTASCTRGELHFCYLIGSISGFVLYHVTAGEIVMRTIKKIAAFFRSALMILLNPLRKAFVLFNQYAMPKFVGYSKVIVKHIKKIVLLLMNPLLLLYNNCESEMRKNVSRSDRKKRKK